MATTDYLGRTLPAHFTADQWLALAAYAMLRAGEVITPMGRQDVRAMRAKFHKLANKCNHIDSRAYIDAAITYEGLPIDSIIMPIKFF